MHVIVMPRHIYDADFAKTVFALYREYGLGQFANWLTMKNDSIQRQEVVESLQFPEVRKSAEELIEFYRFKIDELKSMLAESESASA
jgi:hypothetical protein